MHTVKTKEEIQDKIDQVQRVIYLDECAAGVLGGDLFVCGVVFEKEALRALDGVNDSKKLTEKKRADWFPKIVKWAVDYEIVRLSPQEVDALNIFQARMEGFRRAIEVLAQRTGATYAIIDGNKKPAQTAVNTVVLVKADALIPGVSCASIVAKHSHTLYIQTLCQEETYRRYGLEQHKGYGTVVHLEKLKEFGPIEGFHRMSYQPVKDSVKNKQ